MSLSASGRCRRPWRPNDGAGHPKRDPEMGLIGGVRAYRAGHDCGCIEMPSPQPRRAPMVPSVEQFCPEHAPSTNDLRQLASHRDFSLLTVPCVPRTFARRGSHTRSGRPSAGHRLVPPAAWVEGAPGAQGGGPLGAPGPSLRKGLTTSGPDARTRQIRKTKP